MPVMSDTTLYQGAVVMDLDGNGSKRDSSSSEEGIRVLNSSDEEKCGEEILGIKLNDTSNEHGFISKIFRCKDARVQT